MSEAAEHEPLGVRMPGDGSQGGVQRLVGNDEAISVAMLHQPAGGGLTALSLLVERRFTKRWRTLPSASHQRLAHGVYVFNGNLIEDPHFVRLHYPPYWHYDRCAGSLLDGSARVGWVRKRGPGASADQRNAPHENAAVKRRKARRSA